LVWEENNNRKNERFSAKERRGIDVGKERACAFRAGDQKKRSREEKMPFHTVENQPKEEEGIVEEKRHVLGGEKGQKKSGSEGDGREKDWV